MQGSPEVDRDRVRGLTHGRAGTDRRPGRGGAAKFSLLRKGGRLWIVGEQLERRAGGAEKRTWSDDPEVARFQLAFKFTKRPVPEAKRVPTPWMKSERLAKLPVFTQVTGPLWARLPMTCPRSLKPQSPPDRGRETGHLIVSSDGGRPLTWVTASMCVCIGQFVPGSFLYRDNHLSEGFQLLGRTGLVDRYLPIAV